MTQSGLELHQGYLTDSFPVARDARAREAFTLSKDQCRRFEREGFVAGIELLSQAQVDELRLRLESLVERLPEVSPLLHEVEAAWLERPDEVVLHFLGAWRVDELFHDLVFHPGAAVPAAQLLATEHLRFWHDQVFWKPAQHPGVVPWHQDYSYWTRTGPPAHITVFIALDDMGPENGGLEYVPGSHRFGLLPKQDFGGSLDALHAHLTPDQETLFKPEAIRLRAGQAALHHSHLVHGSRGNKTNGPRRATVLNYMADGTRVLDGAPLLRGVESIPTGQRVSGAHFPLLF